MESEINNPNWIYPVEKRRKKFFEDEMEEMKKDKWIESEKVHYDLGEQAYLNWIKKWASRFRIIWESKYGSVK